MGYFLMVKATGFFVAYTDVGNSREQERQAIDNFANSSLLPSITASNTIISFHQKSNPDLIRGSLANGTFL